LFALIAGTLAGKAAAVEVSVWTIRATRSKTQISDELKPLAKALTKNFKFTGYELLKKDAKKVDGTAVKFKLAGGFGATVKDKGKADGKFKLGIEVNRTVDKTVSKKLSTTVSLKPGRFQLLGGWKLNGKDVLILAVSAK
jgi:hypothetical protein